MRTVTAPQLATMAGASVGHYLKVEIEDAAAAWKDLTALGGTDWIDGATVDCEAIDKPVSTATVTVRREITGVSYPNRLASPYDLTGWALVNMTHAQTATDSAGTPNAATAVRETTSSSGHYTGKNENFTADVTQELIVSIRPVGRDIVKIQVDSGSGVFGVEFQVSTLGLVDVASGTGQTDEFTVTAGLLGYYTLRVLGRCMHGDTNGNVQIYSKGVTGYVFAGNAANGFDVEFVSLAYAPTGKSLAPLLEGSPLNRAAGVYVALLDIGRAIRISVAVVDAGVSPSGGDWKVLFLGRIDKVGWAADPIQLDCSDQGAWLMDTQIETVDAYGSGVGVAAETVMQSILTAWPSGVGAVPTLYVPSSPGWDLHAYNQDRVKLLEALLALAQQIGWDVRYRFDASDVFRLTLWEPDRAKTTPDATIGPAQYTDVTALELALADIRNVVSVPYVKSTGEVDVESAIDAGSVARFGRRWMEIAEGSSSNIDTAAEASAFAVACAHDLSAPVAEQAVAMLLFWPAQFGDLYRFTANGIHYDTDQDLAVVGVRHEFAGGQGVTTLTCRGSVAGAYSGWLRTEAVPSTKSLAVPQVVISVDVDGNYVADMNKGDAASICWLTSTVDYPTDAATLSGGASVDAITGPIPFPAFATGTLSFGQVVYGTALLFEGTGLTGTQLPTVHFRAAFQSYTATKQVRFSGASFIEQAIIGAGLLTSRPTLDQITLAGTSGAITYVCDFELPEHCTVTSVAAEVKQVTTGDTVALNFNATPLGASAAGGGAGAYAGFFATTPAINAWETVTVASLAQTTTGMRMQVELTLVLNSGGGHSPPLFRAVEITYVPDDPKATV